MAFKQPRVPEYRGEDGMQAYIRTLVLFLKDFCAEAWMQSRKQQKAIEEITQKLEKMRLDGGQN